MKSSKTSFLRNCISGWNVRFISSEVSFDSSEEFFISYLGNKKYPRGDFEISTWKSLFSDTVPYRDVVSSNLL